MVDPRWLRTAFDSWLLTCDAAVVIWLRLGKLALGDAAAAAEAQLMVEEKLKAAALLNWRAMTGRLGTDHHAIASRSLAHYHRAVKANRRRLSRSK